MYSTYIQHPGIYVPPRLDLFKREKVRGRYNESDNSSYFSTDIKNMLGFVSLRTFPGFPVSGKKLLC